MPANELTCPACSSRLSRPASLRDGEPFECPMCATEFRVGANVGGITTARRPALSAVDELEELDDDTGEELEVLDGRTRRKKRKRRPSGAVELGHWIKLGFMHWMPMLPPSIAFALLYVIIYVVVGFVIGFLGGLLNLVLPVVGKGLALFALLSIMVPLSGGMTLVSVQQLQGKRWSFSDFFSASQWWLSLVFNFLLLQIFYSVLMVVPAFALGLLLGPILPPELILILAYGFAVLAYLLLYPFTWMFSWQLIVDGNYGPIEAITEGFQVALPHYFKLLPLAALTLFIRAVGFLLLGVGFAAAWPLAILIESTAYLRLTGRRVTEDISESN